MNRLLNRIFKWDFSFYYEASSWSNMDWICWWQWKLNEERSRMCDAKRDASNKELLDLWGIKG